jgi:hypothetical protein
MKTLYTPGQAFATNLTNYSRVRIRLTLIHIGLQVKLSGIHHIFQQFFTFSKSFSIKNDEKIDRVDIVYFLVRQEEIWLRTLG